jgi:hypothetical protein
MCYCASTHLLQLTWPCVQPPPRPALVLTDTCAQPCAGAASKVPTDDAGKASAAAKGDSSKDSADKDKRGALLTFVYAADGGDGENGEVFAVRELQAGEVRG